MSSSQAYVVSVSIEAAGDPVPLLRLVSVLSTRQVRVCELSFRAAPGGPAQMSATVVLLNAGAHTVAAALGRVVGVTEVDLRPLGVSAAS